MRLLKNPHPDSWSDEDDFWAEPALFAKLAEKYDPPVDSGSVLGCGAWGCVYSSNKEGVVAKITLDPTEAQFAELIVKGQIPQLDGIVRYYDVFSLGVVKKYPAFLILREEADNVGDLEGRALRPLYRYSDYAGRMMETMEFSLKEEEYPAIWREAKNYEQYAAGFLHEYGIKNRPADLEEDLDPKANLAQVIAIYLRVIELSAYELAKIEEVSTLGLTLLGYFEEGIIFGDVYEKNIGMTERGWAITDPGGNIVIE